MFVAAKSGGDQTFLTDASGQFLLDAKGQYLVKEHRVSAAWLIAAYGVISLGELMLSPMGLSLVSKVAPVRMRGMMMGGLVRCHGDRQQAHADRRALYPLVPLVLLAPLLGLGPGHGVGPPGPAPPLEAGHARSLRERLRNIPRCVTL